MDHKANGQFGLLPNTASSVDSQAQNTERGLLDLVPEQVWKRPHCRGLPTLLQDKSGRVHDNLSEAVVSVGPLTAEGLTEMFKALQDRDARVRSKAARGLGNIGAAANTAIPYLIKALVDKDRQVRKSAAKALGKIGPAAVEAMPQLIRAFEDPHASVRSSAAQALGAIGIPAPEALMQLSTSLEDRNLLVRSCAVEALGKLGAEEAEIARLVEAAADAEPDSEVVLLLGETLLNADLLVRRQAADALGKMGDAAAQAIPPLVQALEDQDADLRISAAAALARTGPADEALPQLIAALADHHAEVRGSAAEALGMMGPAAAEAVPQLTRGLKDPDSDVRKSAAEALGKIGPSSPDAVQQLLEAFEDADYFVRASAAKALGSMGPSAIAAVPKLRSALNDQHSDVVCNAKLALGKIERSEGRSLLQSGELLVPEWWESVPFPSSVSDFYSDTGASPHWLSSRVEQSRANSGSPCSAFEVSDPEVLLAPAPSEASDASSQDEEAYSQAESEAAGAAAVQGLLQALVALGDEDSEVSSSAEEVLDEFNSLSPKSARQWIKMIDDQDWQACCSGAEGLSNMALSGVAAVPQLLVALGDQDRDVHKSAAYALSKLGAEAAEAMAPLLNAEAHQASHARDNLCSVLAQADPRKKVHSLLLQLALSICPEGDASSDPIIARAVLYSISFGLHDDAVRSAVMALPRVLRSGEFSSINLHGLLQKARHKAPDAVKDCKLDGLLDIKNLEDPGGQAASIAQVSGLACITHSGSLSTEKQISKDNSLYEGSSQHTSGYEVSVTLQACDCGQTYSESSLDFLQHTLLLRSFLGYSCE